MKSTVSKRLLQVGLLLVCTALPAMAQGRKIQGFEVGDPSISSIGDAGAKGVYNGVSPAELSSQFLLTTVGANTSMEDNLGSQAGGLAASSFDLSGFFNSAVPANSQEGSGVLIPFSLAAGETQLTFSWDFLSNEIFQEAAVKRNDFAFYVLFNGVNAVQIAPTVFASVNGSAGLFQMTGLNDPFQFHTGYQATSFSLVGLAPGTYTLGIGVADAGPGAAHASGVLLDNFVVVPEPSVLALTVAGAGLMLGLRRRIKRS